MNPISSRTPEGEPLRCPICGHQAAVELSDPPGDAVCPDCGHWLLLVRDRIAGITGEAITVNTTLDDLGLDSLTVVELVMELEDQAIPITEADFERFRTVRDLIEYLRRHRREGND